MAAHNAHADACGRRFDGGDRLAIRATRGVALVSVGSVLLGQGEWSVGATEPGGLDCDDANGGGSGKAEGIGWRYEYSGHALHRPILDIGQGLTDFVVEHRGRKETLVVVDKRLIGTFRLL